VAYYRVKFTFTFSKDHFIIMNYKDTPKFCCLADGINYMIQSNVFYTLPHKRSVKSTVPLQMLSRQYFAFIENLCKV